MKNKVFLNIFISSFCLFCSLLNSTIIEIRQDGQGDYQIIQEGIDASSNSDTVLVYPGTYYENINFNGHHITLASLEMITGDRSYINSTIINGSQTGSCIRLDNEEQDVLIRGFSITNGFGDEFYGGNYGGGIVFFSTVFDDLRVSAVVLNCNIYDNYAGSGGGICNRKSDIFLSGVRVINNYAAGGGGILSRDDCHLDFDEENLCSIYDNYGESGCDISAIDAENDIHVIVDTFTVAEYDDYFASYNYDIQHTGEMTMDVQNAWLELVNDDLYISTTGDDANSGSTPEDPLKTISWAMHKIVSDSLDPKTIFVEEGRYSRELNDQIFPIVFKSNVSLIGENQSSFIINSSNLRSISTKSKKNIIFSNFVLQSYGVTNPCMTFRDCTNIEFNNIIIEDWIVDYVFVCLFTDGGNYRFENMIVRNNSAWIEGGLHINGKINSEIINSIFDNNHSTGGGDGGGYPHLHCNVKDSLLIQNCIFSNGSANSPQYESVAISAGQFCEPTMNIVYTLFYENDSQGMASLLIVNANETNQNPLNFVNCTFAGNTSPIAALKTSGNVNMYNCIMDDPTPYEIALYDLTGYGIISDLTVGNSNINNGQNGIYNENNANTINWLDGNINEDPLFIGEGDYPFALSELSPCIDAGTLDLPEGIELPEYDLAGNPRIVGGAIDMGAYEFQGTNFNEELIINNERINLSIYPNPFKPNERGHNSSIKFNLLESCNVDLTIYNMKGQKVKTMMDAYASRGEYNCRWNGSDDNGKPVSSGQYVIKLNIDDETKVVRKMIVIR